MTFLHLIVGKERDFAVCGRFYVGDHYVSVEFFFFEEICLFDLLSGSVGRLDVHSVELCRHLKFIFTLNYLKAFVFPQKCLQLG